MQVLGLELKIIDIQDRYGINYFPVKKACSSANRRDFLSFDDLNLIFKFASYAWILLLTSKCFAMGWQNLNLVLALAAAWRRAFKLIQSIIFTVGRAAAKAFLSAALLTMAAGPASQRWRPETGRLRYKGLSYQAFMQHGRPNRRWHRSRISHQ